VAALKVGQEFSRVCAFRKTKRARPPGFLQVDRGERTKGKPQKTSLPLPLTEARAPRERTEYMGYPRGRIATVLGGSGPRRRRAVQGMRKCLSQREGEVSRCRVASSDYSEGAPHRGGLDPFRASGSSAYGFATRSAIRHRRVNTLVDDSGFIPCFPVAGP
jgi:hypothetical protein